MGPRMDSLRIVWDNVKRRTSAKMVWLLIHAMAPIYLVMVLNTWCNIWMVVIVSLRINLLGNEMKMVFVVVLFMVFPFFLGKKLVCVRLLFVSVNTTHWMPTICLRCSTRQMIESVFLVLVVFNHYPRFGKSTCDLPIFSSLFSSVVV